MPRRCHSGATPIDRISASSAAMRPITKPASARGSRIWAMNEADAGCSIDCVMLSASQAGSNSRACKAAISSARSGLAHRRLRFLGSSGMAARVMLKLSRRLAVLRLGIGRSQVEGNEGGVGGFERSAICARALASGKRSGSRATALRPSRVPRRQRPAHPSRRRRSDRRRPVAPLRRSTGAAAATSRRGHRRHRTTARRLRRAARRRRRPRRRQVTSRRATSAITARLETPTVWHPSPAPRRALRQRRCACR